LADKPQEGLKAILRYLLSPPLPQAGAGCVMRPGCIRTHGKAVPGTTPSPPAGSSGWLNA